MGAFHSTKFLVNLGMLGTHSLQNTGLDTHEIRLKFLKIQFPSPNINTFLKQEI